MIVTVYILSEFVPPAVMIDLFYQMLSFLLETIYTEESKDLLYLSNSLIIPVCTTWSHYLQQIIYCFPAKLQVIVGNCR